MYISVMRFEWDEEKNRANIEKHGFDFADAWEIFESPMLTALDQRTDYAEDRWIGLGSFRGRILVVVFTEPDDQTIRIISVRKAMKQERKAYEEAIGN
jgi:hypothetical protein